jgi:zinc/manganese transport system substrate-binding protein
MKNIFRTMGIVWAALLPWTSVHAALNIFACEPEWAALAKELGGDKVSIYTAVTALQDPHRIEARPSLIARARNADLVVCTGAELETGWLPLVRAQAGNAKIQKGQPGDFEATRYVTLVDVPRELDRAQGDVHAAGNPHVHLDPRNLTKIAAALAQRMTELDAAEAQHYRAREKNFLDRWQQATTRWAQQAAPLKGAAAVVYHKDLTYLLRWLDVREAGTLEPKPGLPPTTAHLSELLARLQKEPAKAIVRAAYNDPRAGDWLAERAKLPVVTLPYTVGGTDKARDLFSLFDDTLARLLTVVK